jgi:hypothetical protein
VDFDPNISQNICGIGILDASFPYFLGRKEFYRRPQYEELSDSEEESLSEQEDSAMQEFIDLAMAETADLDNGEILDDNKI